MNESLTEEAFEEALYQFTGTSCFYRHEFTKLKLTDGAQFVREKGGAYWLIDEIAFAQELEPAVAAEMFQDWKLRVEDDRSATLTCGDGNGKIVFKKEIPFTDFPLKRLTLWMTFDTILLPSEY